MQMAFALKNGLMRFLEPTFLTLLFFKEKIQNGLRAATTLLTKCPLSSHSSFAICSSSYWKISPCYIHSHYEYIFIDIRVVYVAAINITTAENSCCFIRKTNTGEDIYCIKDLFALVVRSKASGADSVESFCISITFFGLSFPLSFPLSFTPLSWSLSLCFFMGAPRLCNGYFLTLSSVTVLCSLSSLFVPQHIDKATAAIIECNYRISYSSM